MSMAASKYSSYKLRPLSYRTTDMLTYYYGIQLILCIAHHVSIIPVGDQSPGIEHYYFLSCYTRSSAAIGEDFGIF